MRVSKTVHESPIWSCPSGSQFNNTDRHAAKIHAPLKKCILGNQQNRKRFICKNVHCSIINYSNTVKSSKDQIIRN